MKNRLFKAFNKSLLLTTNKEYSHHRKLFSNAVKRGISSKVDNTFLFILSPPFCGSTLLNQIISTSPAVSVNNEVDTREGQTLPEVRKLMFDHDRRWDETLDYDWGHIKTQWLKYWDQTRPILLEKSPPNILRAQSIQKAFEPAYFIIFYRNPYAHCESLLRRKDPNILEAAQFAIRCLKYQRSNIQNLKNSVAVSYEELTDEPERVIAKFREFMPALGDIRTDQDFTAHNFKSKAMKITNLNDEKISNLSPDEFRIINSVFEQNTDLLQYFGYNLQNHTN